jgi:hypothetical protein
LHAAARLSRRWSIHRAFASRGRSGPNFVHVVEHGTSEIPGATTIAIVPAGGDARWTSS